LSISCGTYPCRNTYQIYNLNDLEPLPFWKKGKMIHKKKKWSDPHPRKFGNKAKVLDFIKSDWTWGFKQNEIIKETHLTKPTVNRILEELVSEHKVHKLNNMYYPEFDDDFYFSWFISNYIDFFLIEIMEKKETISKLMHTLHDSKFNGGNPLHNSVFEFANAMGALITYVLIESSSLYGEDREPEKVEELINNIFKGVIWTDIFYQFQKLFKNYHHDNQASSVIKGFDQLSESLKMLYPTLYVTLDTNRVKYFKDWVKSDRRDNKIHESCHHEWKEHNVFRCGAFYECVHCRCHKLKQLQTKEK
jgi:hypothetical protein